MKAKGIKREWKFAAIVLVVCLQAASSAAAGARNQKIKTRSDEEELQTSGQQDEQGAKLGAMDPTGGMTHDKRLFVMELLHLLREQHSRADTSAPAQDNEKTNQQVADTETSSLKKSDRSEASRRQQLGVGSSMSQLLGAISADGDARRLLDWVQDSLNLATVGELTTQFVVGKLASVNCPALLRPDPEETLVPRFLLFNEHFTDVPFELPPVPSTSDCLERAKFDPNRKTVLLIHGYLGGYTLVDGLTNIKNRLLDLSKLAGDRSTAAMVAASRNNGSYVLVDDLEAKLSSQQYNVIMVDWFNGANPVPRARYIRAAVNAQVVGRLIARFLVGLVEHCRAPARNIEVLAHSLGCHVAGFLGKAMNAAGHRLGQITHLDPIGLCFGRLFSNPSMRLSPTDALETRAVHVSLNLYDNPLDGAHSNFLVNGGRDQAGCGGQSELKNSTSSSVSLLFDSQAKFAPCSHVRALSLFEDDLSSEPAKCQIVGYRCASYERFLAGKCGRCDAFNSQCRLMSISPLDTHYKRLDIAWGQAQHHQQEPRYNRSSITTTTTSEQPPTGELLNVMRQHGNGSMLWLVADKEVSESIGNTIAKLKPELGAKSDAINEIATSGRRSDHGRTGASLLLPVVSSEHRERIALALDKIRLSTRNAIVEGWSTLNSVSIRPLLSAEANEPQQVPSQPPPPQNPDSNEQLVEVEPPSTPPPTPVGGQQLPPGAINGPLYYVGTSSISPYCVNYYQVRLLIAESRIKRLVNNNQLLAAPTPDLVPPPTPIPSPSPTTSKRDMLHLTIKLTDSLGRFFKGFSLMESIRSLARTVPSAEPAARARGEPMIELTMLLNTTRAEPVKVSETIISYYFHRIVLADTVEVNYMSNISPE